ncbi:drug resistance transporter, EmrB/QacA subfamily [Streptomyces sp. 1222.5]|uniref:MFS transporter n=1 Tax=unclassified Streptomyces TaxID=2593676 RepID=UPI00089825DF|nr:MULTISPECIES: MFS transporter [unclassified Streptomyces]PKW07429.1 EmrB/QacA subfamily drug resistance transporter [Streptomyces sp. 5112.2]SEC89118.1 drug resistance transporter, EmrB/QacA subfamily [Streptomyces sp. 1222.5]
MPSAGEETVSPLSFRELQAIALASTMTSLDRTVVVIALPSMAHDLGFGLVAAHWIISVYVLTTAALVLLGGRLGSTIGLMRTFRCGVLVFTLASVACAMVPTAGTAFAALVGFRALQGAGAALMWPVAIPMVTGAFEKASQGRVVALFCGVSQFGGALGPVVGGAVTGALGWRYVFWLNIPLGVLAFILTLRGTPGPRPTGDRPHFTQLFLLVPGICLVVLALQQSAEWGVASWRFCASLCAGLLITCVFCRATLRSRHPQVDLRLLAGRRFGADVLVNCGLQLGLFAVFVNSALYIQEVLRFSPLRAGIAQMPLLVGVILGTQAAGYLFDRTGNARVPVLCGLVCAIAGVGMWIAALSCTSYFWHLPGMVLCGLGAGTQASVKADAMNGVPALRRPDASGLLAVTQQLSAVVGLAVAGTATATHVRADAGPALVDTQAVTAGFLVSLGFLVVTLGGAALYMGRCRSITGRRCARGAGGHEPSAPGVRPCPFVRGCGELPAAGSWSPAGPRTGPR